MNRQQAETAFNDSLRKHIYAHTHQPTSSALGHEAHRALGVGSGQGQSDLGGWPSQGDFVVVLASVRNAVLDLLEQAGVIEIP